MNAQARTELPKREAAAYRDRGARNTAVGVQDVGVKRERDLLDKKVRPFAWLLHCSNQRWSQAVHDRVQAPKRRCMQSACSAKPKVIGERVECELRDIEADGAERRVEADSSHVTTLSRPGLDVICKAAGAVRSSSAKARGRQQLRLPLSRGRAESGQMMTISNLPCNILLHDRLMPDTAVGPRLTGARSKQGAGRAVIHGRYPKLVGAFDTSGEIMGERGSENDKEGGTSTHPKKSNYLLDHVDSTHRRQSLGFPPAVPQSDLGRRR
jgi:hypothetical protein